MRKNAQYTAAATPGPAMSSPLLVRYALFAMLATLANLGSQWASLSLYDGAYGLRCAIPAGTAVGLIVKFWLDKRWIFAAATATVRKTSVQFVLYTLTGIATTLLFWGVELLFDRSVATPWSKYLGATIGLAIGYTVKFRLDARFVFAAHRPMPRTVQSRTAIDLDA